MMVAHLVCRGKVRWGSKVHVRPDPSETSELCLWCHAGSACMTQHLLRPACWVDSCKEVLDPVGMVRVLETLGDAFAKASSQCCCPAATAA